VSIDEIYERNLSVNNNGKVVDEYGNEYRDECGECQYVDGVTIKDMI